MPIGNISNFIEKEENMKERTYNNYKDYVEKNLWQYVMRISPFIEKDEVAEIKELNTWDLLIVFKNGDKYLYDRCSDMHKYIRYDDINELTEEDERKEFAYRLRTMMKRNWTTQEELAKKVNITQAMISRYVTGEAIPNALTLNKISKALNCSMDDFFNKNY